jgi:hypothetical protein
MPFAGRDEVGRLLVAGVGGTLTAMFRSAGLGGRIAIDDIMSGVAYT